MHRSDWNAERAVAAAGDFTELHVAHGGLLWVAFDPASARCRLFLHRDGQGRELTPLGASVRSRVYEYGGGSCCATADGVAWVEEGDQQVRWLRLGGTPRSITHRGDCRYGDLHYVAAWNALLAVEEEGMRHRIVRLDGDGRRRVIAEGADFYASPVADSSARRIAWVEWDRPDQPWTRTRLVESFAGEQRCLAGQTAIESIQQPRFDSHGRLHWLSDHDGYWQPYHEERGALPCAAADHASAPWQLGGSTFLPLADGNLLATRYEEGCGVLVLYDGRGNERRLAPKYSRFRSLAADEQHFYCIAAAPDRLPTLLAIRRVDGSTQVLAGGERPLAEAELSRGEAFRYRVGAEECGHGFFYPAHGASGPPPLVVFLHGGPTSACYPVFDGRIQFWTRRGFAVADLNYRGSSGYGRAYRERLHLGWGQVEVEDIGAALDFLARAGRIDRQRVFVRGASAGGYSALMALARLDGLRGGASLYGVSDPQALARVTHKFEADYLDWLIGDPVQDAERYRNRTPVLLAGDIRVPVIFFQGELDAVVVPAQTDAMVESLRRRGVPVEVHRYAGERHGFRQSANLAHALEAEWRFYQALLAV
ncbi:S9 family peptidase [Pseudomonas sp. LA21]|uniref:S9 family peptidase n=1 Tax=unclassified Pseudomonas TaxID=196821 RepID=UPI001FB6C24B|nr:S9 family peptidase [Pseudomonas sp. LA21]MCJ1887107.1 S9 family peptidase [Pseudomonas sp. LA21]